MECSRMYRAGDIADLHLEADITILAHPGDIVGKIGIAVTAAVIARRGIGPKRTTVTAEQPPDRLAHRSAEDIPQCDVYTGEAGQKNALAAVIIGLLIDTLPNE